VHEPGCLIASSEPKAAETAELVAQYLGMTWSSAPGLHEHERSNVGYLGDAEFKANVARFFVQPDRLVLGDETADQAHGRFARAVDEALRMCDSGNVAIFAHGTVMSLFVGRATGIDPLAFWQSLGLPAFVVLSYPGLELLETAPRME
jgi:broad specificity phosphatase PhoE